MILEGWIRIRNPGYVGHSLGGKMQVYSHDQTGLIKIKVASKKSASEQERDAPRRN